MKEYTTCARCGYDFPANLTHLTDIDATGIICPKCQKEWEEEQKRKDWIDAEFTQIMRLYHWALGKLRLEPFL